MLLMKCGPTVWIVWHACSSATSHACAYYVQFVMLPRSACIVINEIQSSNKAYLLKTLSQVVQLLPQLCYSVWPLVLQ